MFDRADSSSAFSTRVEKVMSCLVVAVELNKCVTRYLK